MSDPKDHEKIYRFGPDDEIGPAPSNDVEVDPDAEPSPNIERPCEGEVRDD